MGSFIDLTNQQIGKWTVLYRADNKNNRIYWHCQCECGTIRDVSAGNLLNDTTQCCGCTRAENTSKANSKHHLAHTRIYYCYHSMINRCYKQTNKSYYRYGAKGIKVCDEWLGEHGFENFTKWAFANGYTDELTLDRYPNQKGNYEPSNCRWATYKMQANNFSRNILILLRVHLLKIIVILQE